MEAGPGQGQQSTEEACVPSWGSRSVWESNSITVVENKFFEDLSEYLCQTAIPFNLRKHIDFGVRVMIGPNLFFPIF